MEQIYIKKNLASLNTQYKHYERLIQTAQAGSGTCTRLCFPNHLQHQLASYMYPMNSMRLFFVTRFLTYSCIVLLCVIFLLLRNKNAILLYGIVIILNDGRYNMIHVFMISSNCFHKFNSCFLLYIFCLIKYK